jgi:hypothetical protein
LQGPVASGSPAIDREALEEVVRSMLEEKLENLEPSAGWLPEALRVSK